MSQRARIQNELVRLGKEGRFLPVSYSADGNVTQINLDSGDFVMPLTVLANEVSGEFFDDVDMGRRKARRRDNWRFQLKLAFPKEVTAELFENDVMDPVPSLPTGTDGSIILPMVFLNLVDGEYNHPPQQDPANGSEITYTFEAVEGRR